MPKKPARNWTWSRPDRNRSSFTCPEGLLNKIYGRYASRIRWVSAAILLAWTGLILRLFTIQIVHGAEYRQLGLRQSQKKQILRAQRGNIYDRKGVPLTANVGHYALAADPGLIDDPEDLAQQLATLLPLEEQSLRKKLSLPRRFVYLDRNCPPDIYRTLARNKPFGLILEKATQRIYPHGPVASQVVGFTNIDDHGVTGLEKHFDTLLRGTPGWEILERNGRGVLRPSVDYPRKPPRPGRDLYLTLDVDYQSILQEELERRVHETEAKSGMGLILDPRTGYILAMASVPGFDPAHVTDYDVENQKLRPVTDQFEPGSTFKIVTLIAALDQGTVDWNTEFNCEYGAYEVDNIRITDHEEYGLLTVPQIIEHSSNVGTIKIAETLGERTLYEYARDLGFGAVTHIDFLGEARGTLRKPQEWSHVSLAEVSMGQEVGVTLLQLAMAYASIANGGYLLKPILVREVRTHTGDLLEEFPVEVIRKISTPEVMEQVVQILKRVVESGTGLEAGIEGWDVAGKTGTAQKYVAGGYSRTQFVSDFVGFLPADQPQILAAIAIDEPRYGYHWGGVAAAVAFRRIMERIIGMDDSITPSPKSLVSRPVKPGRQDQTQTPVVESPAPGILLSSMTIVPDPLRPVPDVRGMSLRKALLTLEAAGLEARFEGSGVVQWQSPAPGKRVEAGSVCRLELE
ncbi:MAG: PASTA domain-containing protein [Candidatus Neomarinimicrobiota bacterium]|nr:MAG: PASTA domain-containing protein [Candidatus Neomarinimicrobiota bacterium]